MFAMCAENVLRLASIDCSSPMSAKIDRNTGSRDPSAAGIRRPACAISASRPAVLSATVLPPVFGPVTSSTVGRRQIILMVTGTGCFEQRMPRRLQLECAVGGERGSTPSIDCENRARAWIDVELGRRLDRALQVDGRARNASVSASRIRRTSSASCSSSATMSLLISTVLSGSRYRLAPLVDAPCTMPGMPLRCSAFTTST